MERQHDTTGGGHDGSNVADREDHAIDAPPVIGTDERRMHVRAYNYWVSLLKGRAYPSIDDLDTANIGDFGPHGVLLDFTSGGDTPDIAWIGTALRAECDLPDNIKSVAEVPARSLLSRLTDHHLQIIANRAPIGFEAEFVDTRGDNTMYRGILLPFSSDGDTIDFIYGVINWKKAAPAQVVLDINNEISQIVRAKPKRPMVPVWADGPSRHSGRETIERSHNNAEAPIAPRLPVVEARQLAEWLVAARATADALRTADSRTRAALYRALDQAYDFALMTDTRQDEYTALLAESGIKIQARAPMTPVTKLIFGSDYDKTRLTEFAAALSFARRRSLPAGGMKLFLESYPGGLKAIVAADRRERRPEPKAQRPDAVREQARILPEQAYLALSGNDEFVVLVARRIDPERVAVIGILPDDKSAVDKALKLIIQ